MLLFIFVIVTSGEAWISGCKSQSMQVFHADGNFAPSKDIQPSYKPPAIKGYRDAEIPSGERR